MSLKIKELPETERPYEKLEQYGPEKLTNAELLAIIIKTGTKEETAVQLAQRVRQTAQKNRIFGIKICAKFFKKMLDKTGEVWYNGRFGPL